MPQLILEYSANIYEKNALVSLLQKAHALLAQYLPTDIAGCKSRAIERSVYCVGDGHANNAFVHVSLQVLSGRDSSVLQQTGQLLMELLKSYFAESLQKLNLQITIEVSYLSEVYLKATS